jgi:hypothetical protein
MPRFGQADFEVGKYYKIITTTIHHVRQEVYGKVLSKTDTVVNLSPYKTITGPYNLNPNNSNNNGYNRGTYEFSATGILYTNISNAQEIGKNEYDALFTPHSGGKRKKRRSTRRKQKKRVHTKRR